MNTQMEKLFAELSDEDGDYGYSLRWATKHVLNEETKRYESVEDPSHNSFEYDGVSFTYMMKKSRWSDEKYPMVLASWSVRTAIDDANDYEEWVDPETEEIHNMIRRIDNCDGRLEWEEE